jgi:pSer/pThr/pTyr-binding forkhead associated (FHA) protein
VLGGDQRRAPHADPAGHLDGPRHAEIRIGTPSFVSDLGSTNGIVVDNQHVTQAPLRDGSVIHLGTTTIVFRQQG